MDKQNLLSVDFLSIQYGLDLQMINSLHEFGLIELIEFDEIRYLSISDLAEAERIFRLHNELDINKEGIDVVLLLLEKIKKMQEEILSLKNRLRLHGS